MLATADSASSPSLRSGQMAAWMTCAEERRYGSGQAKRREEAG